ncbi:MAG: hypothetical protein D3904_15775, partial [Candidatus Electrothrix sp. EH2]|nr:hypothetical protein [Candidatus Electrothrix sp. EH2]
MTKQETSAPQNAEEIRDEQTPEENAAEENENLPIGKLLRQVREKKAMTIQDISRETNISSSNLTSIELGHYEDLPADTFVRGQVAIYANFLGLDGEESARLFFEERAQCFTGGDKTQSAQQKKGLSAKELAEPNQISSATWAVTLLLLIVTFLVTFSWYTGWSPFGYFFQQEPHQISTAATVIHPTDSEIADHGTLPKEKTTGQTAAPSSTAKST